MKKLLVVLSVVVGSMLFVGNVFAEIVYTYPADAPIFSIAFPDDWTVELDQEDQRGMFALSPDELIEFDIWPLDEEAVAENPEAALDQAIEEASQLVAENVTDFQAGEPTTFEVNGIKFVEVAGTAKYVEDGSDINVSMLLFSPDGTTDFMMIYWGTPEGEKTHEKALKAIVQSIKKP